MRYKQERCCLNFRFSYFFELYLAIITLFLRIVGVFILIILGYKNGKKDEINSPQLNTQYIVVEAKTTVNNLTIQRSLEEGCVA